MQESQSSPAVEGGEEDDEENISQKSQDINENDEETTPTFLTRRQNSVPGGRSLAMTGHEGTIIQGSPFIYCGAPPMQHTPINSHRRLMHHNSMRTPTAQERNNNSNNLNEINNSSNNNNNTRSLSGSRRLKRHDTDPSMGKNGLFIYFLVVAVQQLGEL
uniref:Uncharacterized protein n=1 Tax=Panagrolaimus sp. ES5 TaxID=591445 RepID=A0AC34FQR7_9BILA